MKVTKEQLRDAERRGLTLDEFLDEIGAIALSIEPEIEYTKCVRCGLKIPANETSLHVEEFHNDEFQSWKKRFGFDKEEFDK